MTPPATGTVIVGGGMLGLTLALRLRNLGYAVTVIEGAQSVGGLAMPQTLGDFTWDKFYHVTSSRTPASVTSSVSSGWPTACGGVSLARGSLPTTCCTPFPPVSTFFASGRSP